MAELVTESVAANFYAVAWNKLDVGIIKELLDENVEYILKKNNQSLKGRKDLLIYLQKNMNRIKKAPIQYEIYAEIAETFDDKQCVLLAQGDVDKIKNAVFFTVEKGKITKIIVDKYDPEVVVWRSGNYPGTEDQLASNEYVENKPKLVSSFTDEENFQEENQTEEEIDIKEIKEKFLETHPEYNKKKKNYKNPILAAVLGFLLPGFGLFYVSLKHGFYNLISVFTVSLIYFMLIVNTVSSKMADPSFINSPNWHHTSSFSGLFLGMSIFGILMRIGSAAWGYFAAKSQNGYFFD